MTPSPATIRAARLSLGMTQAQAAERMSWTARYWSMMETGRKEMSALDWEVWQHRAGVEAMPFTSAISRI